MVCFSEPPASKKIKGILDQFGQRTFLLYAGLHYMNCNG